MKSPEETLKRWLHPAVFATWTGFLVYVLASRRYLAFLRPEFAILLALALLIAAGFLLAAMIRPKSGGPKAEGIDTSAVLRSLVLLVPVLYYAALPDGTLGRQAFQKRFVGTHIDSNEGAAGPEAAPMIWPWESETDSEVAPPLMGTWGARQAAPQGETILEIFRDPGAYQGQRVVFTGMILRDEELKPHFGGRDTAVYRFLITCCVADALPLAIALESEMDSGLDSNGADAWANDQWVQVDGILDLRQINGKPVPIVSKPQIKPVEVPAFPYLF